MKKLILIATLALASCTSARYAIGINEAEFLKQNPGADLVEARGNVSSIYKLHIHNSRVNEYKFFVFSKGSLIGVDSGTPRPDITIDQTVHNN